MATVVNTGVGWAATTNTFTYTSGAHVPTAGELYAMVVELDGSTATDWVATDGQGGTWIKAGSARGIFTASADFVEIWVRESAMTAVSTTFTFSHPTGDDATGSICRIFRIAGLTRFGASAVRQVAEQDNGAAAGTPAPAFGVAVLTGNPTIGVLGNGTNPATVTPPGGWTEAADLGHATPARGWEGIHRNSGFTGTTVTWGSTSGTAFGAVVVELDTSAVPSASDPGWMGGGWWFRNEEWARDRRIPLLGDVPLLEAA